MRRMAKHQNAFSPKFNPVGKPPEGAPEDIVRIVSENARTLKFSPHSFEKEQPP